MQFDPECEEDRLLLVNAILHAADIGNGIRPFEINDAMSKRVHREFQVLAEEEGRLGIPVTFAIDSNNPLVCAQVRRSGSWELWCDSQRRGVISSWHFIPQFLFSRLIMTLLSSVFRWK